MKAIKAFFSSFTIKLFICFWLIATISIISTRFISHQLSNDSNNEIIKQKSKPEELYQLAKVAKRIRRKNLNDLNELTTEQQQFNLPVFNIWFKAVETPEKIISYLPIQLKRQRDINEFLSQTSFAKPHTYRISHIALVGPKLITINNVRYQLFLSKRLHKPSFSQIIKDLPYWIRIAIPTVISLLFCLLLARSFSKPVRMMKKAATKLGQGDLSTRVDGLSRRSDELGQLAESFNQMAEKLEQQQSAQKRLLGDVSHELRSPMTRLQMALGLAQQETTTAKAQEQYLQRCQIEIERLDQMVANVLSLSRLENTLQTLDTEKIAVHSLLESIVSDEQFIADEKAIKIITAHTEAAFINGDRTLLTSAISNVLSNAVKYSENNSSVIINVTKQQQWLKLTIEDEGHGVPEEELSQLFNPFYRVNLARDRETGGTGLGLAIAKQAILAHKGKITAQNRTEDNQLHNQENSHAITGLSVTIELPCL